MKNKFKIITMALLSTIIFMPVVCNAEDPEPSPSPTPEVTPTPSPSPSPTPSTTPETTLSGDNYLKSLSVDGFTLNETFSKTTTKYTLTASSTTTKIVIKAEANDDKATVSGIGTVTLYSGSSTVVKVSVKAEDGSIKTYTIEVKKEESNLNLQTLKVKGQTLNETFDPEKLEYTMDVEYDIETIAITAAASDSKAIVTTTGGSVLKVGENTVTIVVKDSYGNKKTYTIIVTRKDEEEETATTSTSQETSKEVIDTVTSDKENPIKYVLVTIASLLLITIGGLGIYFYIKTSDPMKKQKKLEKKRQKLLEKANKLSNLTEVKESPLVEVEDKKEVVSNDEDINDQDTLEFRQPVQRTSRMSRHDENVLSGIEDLFEDK